MLQKSGNNIISINAQDYEFEITLLNNDFHVHIPYDKVLEFIVEETIYTTFPSGRLMIDNAEDMIESYTATGKNERGQTTNNSFNFASDGTDLIIASIRPVAGKGMEGEDEALFPAAQWQLFYAFAVVNEQAVHTTSNLTKAKILTLMDVRELMLTQTTSPWSTNTVLANEVSSKVNLSQKSNEDRKVQSGLAIKNFLTTTLGEDTQFAKDWDNGKTKVFYSVPGTSTDMSVLLELLDSHVSESSSDNCLLRLERNNTFSLRSYEEYFKRAINKTGQGNENGPGAYIMDAFSLPYQSGPQQTGSTTDIETERQR